MIYWDHNASTPLRPEVAALLRDRLASPVPGNASSVHRGGREARARLDAARIQVAGVLGCEPKEVCFTGSGSEADALAIKGAFLARKDPARVQVVTSAIEHAAIRSSLPHLRAAGAELIQLPVGRDGRVDPEVALTAIGPKTALCSLMWANNETGVLQPVAEIARACRKQGVLFHTDAVQAAGKVPVTLREVDADLLSISAHKFGGPPGVGALVVRRGVEVQPLTPGHQESGRRGGTHNVLYVEALARALGLAAAALPTEGPRVAALRDRFERGLRERFPDAGINGGAVARVPTTSSVHFPGIDGEALLIALDLAGICVSAGAACASGSLSPSHVLTAMGMSAAQAHGSLRFSLGWDSTDAEVDRVLEVLVEQVPKAREAAGR